MLRRTARLRKEYLYRKSLEERERLLAHTKVRLKDALENGKPVPSDTCGATTHKIVQTLDLDDNWTKELSTHADDEYAYAGIKDPRVVVTTSRDPSARLQQFAKELRLLIPNCQRINRGGYVLSDLVGLCRGNEISDLLIIHEHRGEPDGLVVCHLPHGPTAHFSLTNVVLRHDLPEKPATMSEAAPHLVFHNFSSCVGQRVTSILKHLFPPSSVSSRRLEAFINLNDMIHFRHYTWATNRGKPTVEEYSAQNPSAGLETTTKGSWGLELVEVGPRFTLQPFRIELGTVEMRDLECEWALRPFFNRKRAALS